MALSVNRFYQLTQDAYKMQKHLKDFDLDQLEQEAKKLIFFGNQLVREKVMGIDHPFIPLPVALASIELLSDDSIQYCDTTKYLLSKVSRIFIECVLYDIFLHNRHIYSDTKKDMMEQLEKVKSTLPKTAVATLFEVECSIAAVKGLEPGKGYFKELAKDKRVELGTGTLSAAAGSFRRLLVTSSKLFEDLYTQLGETWYLGTWNLRWEFTHLNQIDQFTSIQAQIGSIKNIREKGEHFSFCVAEIFMEILTNENVHDSKLKNRVFSGESDEQPGLLHLADLVSSLSTLTPFQGNQFWKTRYRVIEHLHILSENTDYSSASIGKLTFRFRYEKNSSTAELLQTIFINRFAQEKEKEQSQRLYSNACALLDKASLEEQNQQVKENLQKQEAQAKQCGEELEKLQQPTKSFLQGASDGSEEDNSEEISTLSQKKAALEITIDGLKIQQENLKLILKNLS